MATEIVPFTPDLRPALRRFVESLWKRPRSEDFYRWRYDDPPFHAAYLAMRDGECLAMESAFRRPWRVGDEIVEFLEVFDWFSRPELRNAGLGVRVMQRFMREPHPLFLVGGTPDTQGLLPRLKWQVVGQSSRWVLPVGAERTADALAERLRAPLPLARLAAPVVLTLTGRRPRRRAVPRGGRVDAVATLGSEIAALQRGRIGYGALPLWSPELLRWILAGYAGAGHVVPLYFSVDGALGGFSLLRIHRAETGCDAEIVDLFAPSPDPDLYTWMISETVLCAAAFRPGRIGTSTTCDAVGEALRRNAFVRTQTNPVQVWWPGREGLPSPLLIGSNTGDSPILPLVDRWWDAPPPGGGSGSRPA